MTRATHLTYILITLITTAFALVPHQFHHVERRQIPADQRKMLLEAAAAGLKLVHAAPDSRQKRQAPNQLCIQDALLSAYENDPEATPLCSALIAEPAMTATVTVMGTT